MILRLIAVPVVISLGVTVVRLIGEIAGVSDVWFDPWAPMPGRPLARVIGITWLALPFGAWFGWRLARRGDGPRSSALAALLPLAAVLVVYALGPWIVRRGLVAPLAYIRLEGGLIFLAAGVLWLAWPALGRTMFVYGLLARLPVVIVMFFAMREGWGTHYDFQGVAPAHVSTWVRSGLVPQLTGCLALTVATGMVAGCLSMALLRPALAPSPRE